MRNAAFLEYNAASQPKEIEISLNERFPITLMVKDNSDKTIETYRLVKTKSNKFMLQK